jgi:hypothetical protein
MIIKMFIVPMSALKTEARKVIVVLPLKKKMAVVITNPT